MKRFFIVSFITCMLTIHEIQPSHDPFSQKFKRLTFPSYPNLQLATSEDLKALKEGLVQYRSIESQLHDLFGRYSLEHDYCESQKKLCKIGNISLSIYALAIPLFAWTDTTNFIKSLPVSACFIPFILKIRKISQDYEHDKNLLIQKCTQAFEQNDLDALKKFYENKKNNDNYQHHLRFLHKIMERKKWISENKPN